MTPSETAIAKGLSEAQRKLLCAIPAKRWKPWRSAMRHAKLKKWPSRMFSRGLIVDDGAVYQEKVRLTEKGLRIRSYLISKGS